MAQIRRRNQRPHRRLWSGAALRFRRVDGCYLFIALVGYICWNRSAPTASPSSSSSNHLPPTSAFHNATLVMGIILYPWMYRIDTRTIQEQQQQFQSIGRLFGDYQIIWIDGTNNNNNNQNPPLTLESSICGEDEDKDHTLCLHNTTTTLTSKESYNDLLLQQVLQMDEGSSAAVFWWQTNATRVVPSRTIQQSLMLTKKQQPFKDWSALCFDTTTRADNGEAAATSPLDALHTVQICNPDENDSLLYRTDRLRECYQQPQQQDANQTTVQTCIQQTHPNSIFGGTP